MALFRSEILKALKKELPDEKIELITPPDPCFGDLAFACFSLSKKLGKQPNVIAQELCRNLSLSNLVKKIEIKGPYLNFFVNEVELAKKVLKEIAKSEQSFGSKKQKQRVLVEHTSINPNASPHIGRARNALIGDSIVRLQKFLGNKVEVHYFVNDVGKQIAMLVYGAKKKPSFNELLGVYVEINKKFEKKPELEKALFEILNKLENNDKTTKKAFRDIVGTCIKGQSEILAELGISYDFFDYESEYLWKKETNDVLKKLEKTGKLFVDEQGRKVLDQSEYKLAMKAPYLVLTRQDGTSLYPLRDLAYTIDKLKVPVNIIVLGEDHKLYFQQLSAALKLLGFKAPRVVHYSFVLLQAEKMSTRKGNLVLLEDFMTEAREKAQKEILKRDPKIQKKELEKLSKIVGYGALKYSILKVSAEKNVLFDWSSSLNFEGETAPYIQYAHARISSILRKHGKSISPQIDYRLLKHPAELFLIKRLSLFPDLVEDAANSFKPHLIATYAYELAKGFSDFYHNCPILKAEKGPKEARLLLVSCVKHVIKSSLLLLGIESPERM